MTSLVQRTRHVAMATTLLTPLGCVTTHYGDETASPGKDYAVSCGDNSAMSYGRFQGIVCSVENTSEQWQTFSIRSASLRPAAVKGRILDPAELKDFLTAYHYEQEKVTQNVDLALGGLVALGVGAMAGGDRSVATAGAVTAVTASAVAGSRGPVREIHAAQYGGAPVPGEVDGVVVYGPEHLLGGEFRIPPALFVRKSLIVETTSARDQVEVVEVCFDRPKAECLTVPVSGQRRS